MARKDIFGVVAATDSASRHFGDIRGGIPHRVIGDVYPIRQPRVERDTTEVDVMVNEMWQGHENMAAVALIGSSRGWGPIQNWIATRSDIFNAGSDPRKGEYQAVISLSGVAGRAWNCGPFIDRVYAPVLLMHGDDYPAEPIGVWPGMERICRDLIALDKDVIRVWWQNQRHGFIAKHELAQRFLRRWLGWSFGITSDRPIPSNYGGVDMTNCTIDAIEH